MIVKPRDLSIQAEIRQTQGVNLECWENPSLPRWAWHGPGMCACFSISASASQVA